MYLQPKTKRRHFKAIFKEEDGATAIEFAMLGLPFLALLFGIIELALIFFISSTTQHALETAARQIRTGEFQNSGGTAAAFKTKICTAMAGLGSCSNLRIDVVTSNTGRFSDLVLAASPPATDPNETEEEKEERESNPPVLPADSYAQTAGGDVVIVRVQYKHTLIIPTAITRLANASGNTHIITHTTAFRNEPFSTTP